MFIRGLNLGRALEGGQNRPQQRKVTIPSNRSVCSSQNPIQERMSPWLLYNREAVWWRKIDKLGDLRNCELKGKGVSSPSSMRQESIPSCNGRVEH